MTIRNGGRPMAHHQKVIVVALLGAALMMACCDPASAQVQQAKEPTLTLSLAATRAALDKYKNPLLAVRDGYFSTVACLAYPASGMSSHTDDKPGAMGVHFLNPSN